MSQNLFVGSLAFATRDDGLRDFFAQIGEVKSARVITERESGRSKGFGFVEFEDEANNQKAIDQLNGKELDGRPINISLAQPKPEGGARREGGFRGGDRGPRRDFGGNRSGGRGFRDTGNGIRGFDSNR